MDRETYFVALPFSAGPDGELLAGEPREERSPSAAIFRARQLASVHGGAIAFSRAGDRSLGDYEAAVVIGRFGETPNDLASYVG